MKDDALSSVSGCYFLTSEGRLGYYDDRGQWIPDIELNRAFGSFNLGFIQSYLREPDAGQENGRARVAVICTPPERKKWNSAMLILETPVLKGIFRVIGAKPNDELTEFQKRNREMSIFRGMELMLEYRLDTFPSMPIYCPVLFDRHTTLDGYAASFGRAPTDADAATPVIEVLNLLSAIPMKRRSGTAVSELIRRIHRQVINKNARKGPGFAVVDDVMAGDYCPIDPLSHAPDALPAPKEPLLPPQHAPQVAEQEEQNLSLEGVIGLEKVLHPVAPELLRQFDRLCDLDTRQLEFLISYCRLYRASPGTRLLERGSQDDDTIYLVQGEVELKAADGVRQTIKAGTPEARRPIAQLKPRLYQVTAVTPVAFVRVREASLAQALKGMRVSSQDDRVTRSSSRTERRKTFRAETPRRRSD